MSLSDKPHRRLNPLTGEWVLVSPHRTKRPWQGQLEESRPENRPPYDPGCYLCPGNERAGGKRNPAYAYTFVFENDFAALMPEVEQEEVSSGGLFVAKSEQGRCRVICFSPRHDLTLALMEHDAVRKVIDIWDEQFLDLSRYRDIGYVQIFENRGAVMGCSNPHPHGQIWANQTVPDIPRKEDAFQLEYFRKNGSPLLLDYARSELEKGERIIFHNDSFVALVPYWAIWPFETIILPRNAAADIGGFSEKQREDLADVVRRMAIRFDNLFRTTFPYSMGIHQRPTRQADSSHWTFHLHFLPPLLRSATIKKFMVGYELLAMPQRDITPEQSAQRLRECSDEHYTAKSTGV